MAETTYKYLDPDGLARFKSKIQDILDTKVDKETGKYLVTVDSALSSSSTNPVRNSAVTVALNGKLGTSGDSKDNTVTFTSGDVANDAAATSWTADVGTISSGLTHATLLNRLSLAVKNSRYLKNLLGSTDISAIGGGTVTGALLKLNTDLASVHLSGLRHKNLGTQPTAAQLAKIAAGDFSEFWNGDYWSYGGRTFRVWDNTDFMFRRGDTEFRKHGLIIMCDANLIAADGQTHYMNDTNTTEGAYKGCKYRSTYKAQCKSIIEAWCGTSHVATYRGMISNATSNGKA